MSWEKELIGIIFFGLVPVFILTLLCFTSYPYLRDIKRKLIDEGALKRAFEGKAGIVYVMFLLTSFNAGLWFFLLMGLIPLYYLDTYLNFFGNFELNLAFVIAMVTIGLFFNIYYGIEVSGKNRIVTLREVLGITKNTKWTKMDWVDVFVILPIFLIIVVSMSVFLAFLLSTGDVSEPENHLNLVFLLIFGTILSLPISFAMYLAEQPVKIPPLKGGFKSIDNILTDIGLFILFTFCFLMLLIILGVNLAKPLEEYQFAIIMVLVFIPSILFLLLSIIDNHAERSIIEGILIWLKSIIRISANDALSTKERVTLITVFLYLSFVSLWLVFVHPCPSPFLYGITFVLEIYLVLALISYLQLQIPFITEVFRYPSPTSDDFLEREHSENNQSYYWLILLIVGIFVSISWLYAFYSTL